MLFYIGIYVTSTLVASLSQILLKKSAKKDHGSVLKEYLNLEVIIAYGLMVIASVMTVIAYRKVPLSMGPVLESTGYFFVPLLSYFLLQETITKKKVFWLGILFVGILIFSI